MTTLTRHGVRTFVLLVAAAGVLSFSHLTPPSPAFSPQLASAHEQFPNEDGPVSITSEGTTTSTVEVPAGAGTIADLNVIQLSFDHRAPAGLTISLTSPAGSEVGLFSRVCDGDEWSQDNTSFALDDEADTPIGEICPPGTKSSTYLPQESLSLFDSEGASGTWTLSITDTGASEGQLLSWGVEIERQPISVNSTTDPGTGVCDVAECTLREAIVAANGEPGKDSIQFSIGSGLQSIAPTSPLPTITDPVIIDGTTQPGFSGAPIIELNGAVAGAVNGLTVTAGNSTIKGLVINRFEGNGIELGANGGNTVFGNHIGTDSTGTSDVDIDATTLHSSGNLTQPIPDEGIIEQSIAVPATGTVLDVDVSVRLDHTAVGDIHLALVSPNGTETVLSSFNGGDGDDYGSGSDDCAGNHTVFDDDATTAITSGSPPFAGRFRPEEDLSVLNGISDGGTWKLRVIDDFPSVAGTFFCWKLAIVTGGQLGNEGGGIVITGPDNVIGGTSAGARNVIVANGSSGVAMVGSGASGNTVVGNHIGTDATGTVGLGNSADGVQIDGASNNTIGGTVAGARNVIAGNGSSGVGIRGSNRCDGTGVETQHSSGNLNAAIPDDGSLEKTMDVSSTGTVCNVRVFVRLDHTWVADIDLVLVSPNGTEIELSSDNGGDGNDYGNGSDDCGGNPTVFDDAATSPISSGSAPFAGSFRPERALSNLNGISDGGTWKLRVTDDVEIDAGTLFCWKLLIDTGGSATRGSGNRVIGNYIGVDATGLGALGNDEDGVAIVGAPNNFIGGTTEGARNVISGNAGNGVFISGTSNTAVGNFIGTDVTGASPLGNSGEGVLIDSADNAIGGVGSGDRNVISGNGGSGVYLSGLDASGNVVKGNYIGTDSAGTAGLGNSVDGVSINADSNTIGGTDAAARNVISANGRSGITIFGSERVEFPRHSTVRGNYIGTDVTGTQAIGNTGIGVTVAGGLHTVGGASTGAGNLISGNHGAGIAIVPVRLDLGGGFVDVSESKQITIAGNYIGTDATGNTALGNAGHGVDIIGSENTIGGTSFGAGNTIAFNAQSGIVVVSIKNSLRANSIHSNGSLGIDLGGDGVTANDPGDIDGGPNNLQNSPVLTEASGSGGDISVEGHLDAAPNTAYQVEVFSSEECDPSGTGEGGALIGIVGLITDSDGKATFFDLFSGTGAVAATATDPAGNTSEFSNCMDPRPSVFTVTSTADMPDAVAADGLCSTSGDVCTLRAAIQESNTSSVKDEIRFAIESGPQTIQPGSALPTITGPVTIDATTQPGFAGSPLIELDGTSSGAVTDGLSISGGDTTVKGFVVNDFGRHGMSITGAGTSIIQGNYIGTDVTGALDRGNGGDGIRITDSSGNVIGGNSAALSNVLSANGGRGLVFSGSGSILNSVRNNRIGVGADGSTPLGNGSHGIAIFGSASGNQIGGASSGAPNTIAHNLGDGIFILSGTNNPLSRNEVNANAGLGIDLGNDGVTANDPGDGDTGANQLQNFPVLSSAVLGGGTTAVTGTLNSAASQTYSLDFYSSAACDPSGNGEGATHLGSATVTTNGSGSATIDSSLPEAQFVTATATDAAGNTSEFSPCVRAGYPLTAAKAGTGSGSVTSAPAGIDCGSDCTHTYAPPTVVTLTATPGSGSSFSGWSGACSTATGTCSVTMSQARSVTATFATSSSCPGFASDPRNQIVGTPASETLTGTTGPDIICGLGGNDRLEGGAGDDVLLGGIGIDALSGSAGTDRLDGGTGRDSLTGGAGADTLIGGLHGDTATYGGSPTGVTVNLSTTPGTGSGGDAQGDSLTGIENLWGTGFVDSLTGSTAANTIRGFGSGDTLKGLGGTDTLDYTTSIAGVTIDLRTSPATASGGHAQGDVASLFERIVGSGFGDVLHGNSLANWLTGAAGNDSLFGYGGDDRLLGQAGTDSFDGGPGTDFCDEVAGESVVNCE